MQATQALALAMLMVFVVCGSAQQHPQGGTNEDIRQAQNTNPIPSDATIQKVQEGIELAGYENIPGDQRINLFEILGEHVPPKVVNNLQAQADQ